MTTAALGKLGEAKLEELSSEASMVSNPAKLDLLGFDNLVQFEFERESHAHDLLPEPVRAFVQVKATQSKAGSIRIRLTNWQKMISDPDPWFVFVCEVSPERKVTDVYVVHINKHWIEKALRRLRKHPPRKKLGKNEMQITYGVADRLPLVEGGELRSRLLNAIGLDVRAYRRQKTDHYLNLGYHPGSRIAQVTLPPQEEERHHSDWAEVALGVRSNLNVTRVRVLDRRFGEETVIDDAPASVMTIRARPSQLGRLRFFNPNRGHHSTTVDIFSTSSVPFIPAAMSQVRFAVGPLSLFVYTQARSRTDEGNEVSLRATISWNYDHVCSLTELGDAARAMRLMYAPATVMQIEAADPEFLPVEARLGNFPAIEEDRNLYQQTVWAVSSLAKQVGLDALEMRAGDLELIPWTALLAGCIVDGTEGAEFEYTVHALDKDKTPVLAVACGYPLGEWLVFCCGKLPAKPQTKDGEITFTSEGARLLSAWKVRRDQADQVAIDVKYADIVKRLEENTQLQVFELKPAVAQLLEYADEAVPSVESKASPSDETPGHPLQRRTHEGA